MRYSSDMGRGNNQHWPCSTRTPMRENPRIKRHTHSKSTPAWNISFTITSWTLTCWSWAYVDSVRLFQGALILKKLFRLGDRKGVSWP